MNRRRFIQLAGASATSLSLDRLIAAEERPPIDASASMSNMTWRKSPDFLDQALSGGQVVGLGEAHWYPGLIRYQHELVCAPELAGRLTDLVLECGNRRHQALLDAYLDGAEAFDGAPIDEQRLLAIRLDSLSFPAWMSPSHGQLFARLRATNLARPAGERIRVHLAEPAFDWGDLAGEDDWWAINRQRDEAFFRYLEARFTPAGGRGVVVLCGARHLLKGDGGDAGPGMPREPLGRLMAHHQPGRLLSIWPSTSGDESEVAALVGRPPDRWPAIASVADRPQSAGRVLPPPFDDVGEVAPSRHVDACLYAGPQQRSMQCDPVIGRGEWPERLRARAHVLPARLREAVSRLLESLG
ncbi:hypothetical protein SR882_01905 [Guyparkeria halophila]|uniref:Haem-binding uptake Tiki superfamily ChaN domain-containing protein n=1 Tax=Guyparkeria halophila TaxID=47960 RepID=A0ABZ0YWX9_9GAMM|nr:hypothetical protein [Guyparkeria halophila]WQH16678.1 hypothetical protein SR882_01905 [Guyparkeria halophila]